MVRMTTRIQSIIAFLRSGPATSAELAEAFSTHTGDMSRTMTNLRHRGVVERVDGKLGRGTVAKWALIEGASLQ